jgi:hypothetical protein
MAATEVKKYYHLLIHDSPYDPEIRKAIARAEQAGLIPVYSLTDGIGLADAPLSQTR